MANTFDGISFLQKLRKASTLAFIVLLGGGSAMVLIATSTHDVIMWAMGIPIAGMSGVFVTLGMSAKNKLRELGIK